VRYDSTMRICRAAVFVLVLAWCGPAVAAEPPALAKARALYNAGSYEAAIETASMTSGDEQYGDAARLVIGRAHIERYRLSTDPMHLSAARDMFGSIRTAALSARDQVDLLVGLGQTLFFGELFGASAELFDSALGRAEDLPPRDRLRLLDWWASSLEREAQTRPQDRRPAIFTRISERMTEELRVDPGSSVANYWLAAAARGEGDLDRAWDAVVAAWVRSGLVPETSESLRGDLERLVTEALIPERARTRPAREQQEAINGFRMEWEMVKARWK
jgi:hypothetical protein